jgi:hypothetical protein
MGKWDLRFLNPVRYSYHHQRKKCIQQKKKEILAHGALKSLAIPAIVSFARQDIDAYSEDLMN